MIANRETERGVVLLQALLLLLVLGAAVAAVSQQGIRLSRDFVQHRGEMQALYAAEAGLAMARHALARGDFADARIQVAGNEVHVVAERTGDGSIALMAIAKSFPRGRRGTPVQCVRRAAFRPRMP